MTTISIISIISIINIISIISIIMIIIIIIIIINIICINLISIITIIISIAAIVSIIITSISITIIIINIIIIAIRDDSYILAIIRLLLSSSCVCVLVAYCPRAPSLLPSSGYSPFRRAGVGRAQGARGIVQLKLMKLLESNPLTSIVLVCDLTATCSQALLAFIVVVYLDM